MGNLKITEVPQTSAVAATDDFYIKTGENFRRVPVSKLMELFITGGLSGWGIGYATCSTAEATAAKTAALTGYQLIKGGFVAVRFTNAVGGGATLSINSQTAKAIYYNGTAIVNNVIRAGDIAVLCYDGTYYQLVSIMPAGATILELEKSGSTVSLDMTFADAYTVFSNPWNTYLLLTVDTYVVLLMRPSKVDADNLQIYIEATVGTTLYTATLIPVVGQAVLSGTLVETQIGGGSADAVTYSAQTGRTDAEKAQARTNIGALGASDISAYEEKPTVVTVTGDTPVIALAENNKIYKCTGTAITSVTITAVDANAAFCVKFDAPPAVSAPVFNFPTASIKMPTDFALEPNIHYEINVDEDGYALVGDVWEITT